VIERADGAGGSPASADSAVRLAIIGPSFFSYVPAIAAAFRERGFAVSLFDEKHSNRPAAKLVYRLGLAQRSKPAAAHLALILDEIRAAGVTDVFLINTETVGRPFVEQLAGRGVRVHLYMWDGVANKPGFVGLLDAVASRGSFDPVDCERFGMAYIPLFAEAVFDEARELARRDPAFDIGFCGTVHSSRTAIVAKMLAAARRGGPRIGLMLYYHSRWLLYLKGLAQPAVWRIARSVSFKGFAKPEIARLFAASRLVLDVPHPGQTGLTARTFEALAAGSRLLTLHERAREMLPDSFRGRIVVTERIETALAFDFGSYAPLPPLTAEERYYLSLDRFVDGLLAMAGLSSTKGAGTGAHAA
jgi:hypothetical protein